MSNSSFTQGTLPIIRNASRLYRRMASMSVGEVIEVFSSSATPFLSHHRATYRQVQARALAVFCGAGI
jgi:hypothetical protein